MNRTMIVAAGIALGICCARASAAQAEGSGGAGTAEPSPQAVTGTKTVKEDAALRKKLGDQYAAQEDYRRAADEYLTALALAPSAFTRQERLRMAIAISWADRFDDAAAVLRAILAEDPKDREARIHLAKVLSWSNRLQEAEEEADRVLKRHPENQDALLVKANALRWRGDAQASIPFYEKALAQGENFDARIGLAYAYLDAGEKEKAKELSAPLQPLYPYQKKELARFSDSLCGTRASRTGLQLSRYADSDRNRVGRASVFYGFWAGAWDMDLTYRLTVATAPQRRANADELRLAARSRQGRFDTAAEAGGIRTDQGSLATGQARAETSVGRLSLGASAAREALTDTAELIDNRIVRTSGTISLAEALLPRLMLSGRYTHAGFSDSNSSDDLWLNARFRVKAASPTIATGYRFRYWDFRRQSGGGYFDPEDFTSHELFVSFFGEQSGFYVRFDPYWGYQSYLRYGTHTRGLFFGLPGAVGWTMKKCTAFEISFDGGNYAGGTVAGYNYLQVGVHLIAYF